MWIASMAIMNDARGSGLAIPKRDLISSFGETDC